MTDTPSPASDTALVERLNSHRQRWRSLAPASISDMCEEAAACLTAMRAELDEVRAELQGTTVERDEWKDRTLHHRDRAEAAIAKAGEPVGCIDRFRQKYADASTHAIDTLIKKGWTPVYVAAPADSAEPVAWEAAVDDQIRSIAEWDDRTSPEDYPDHLLLTPAELKDFARWVSALASPAPASKGAVSDEQIDAAIREWMSIDDSTADGYRYRMRAALAALSAPGMVEDKP
jgi:hypothetical protein